MGKSKHAFVEKSATSRTNECLQQFVVTPDIGVHVQGFPAFFDFSPILPQATMLSQILSQIQRQQVNPMILFANLQPQVDWDAILSIGLSQLQAHCSSIYPHPTQTTLCLKPEKSYILGGGTDPLDYAYIYKNDGDPTRKVPPHWHYVGFGLSDIHNYKFRCKVDISKRSNASPLPQLYPPTEELSGFGIELTFRLKCDSSEVPPKWPYLVMQEMARYVYVSKNVFSDGDDTFWSCPLHGDDNSRIEHILMTLDPQLKEIKTTLGKVRFIQLVGVCQEELQAAREWNAKGVLNLMKKHDETGGEYLVTDLRREKTIFELGPEIRERVNDGIFKMGSYLAQICSKHKFSPIKPDWFKRVEQEESLDTHNKSLGQESLEQGSLLNNSEKTIANRVESKIEKGTFSTTNFTDESQIPIFHDYQSRNASRISLESESALMIQNMDAINTRTYNSIFLLLSYEAAKVLPIALNGRLAHGKPFSYQSFKGDLLTTFVPEGTTIKSLVTREQSFARNGVCLQIYVTDDLRKQMLDTIKADFSYDVDCESIRLPKNYSWPDHKLYITIEDILH